VSSEQPCVVATLPVCASSAIWLQTLTSSAFDEAYDDYAHARTLEPSYSRSVSEQQGPWILRELNSSGGSQKGVPRGEGRTPG